MRTIVMANAENDDSATVGNDAQFKVPSGEVVYPIRSMCKIRIGTGLTKTIVHPTGCLVDNGEGPDLIKKDYWNPQFKFIIELIESLKFITANTEVISIHGGILLVVHMGDLQTRIWLDFVQNVAADVLLRTTYIDKCIWDEFSINCRIVPEHWEPFVP